MLTTRIERIIAKGQLVPITFGLNDVAVSQTDVQLPAFTGNAVGAIMPFAGEIVAVSYLLSANKTAGSLTIGPTVGGTERTALTLSAANGVASGRKLVKRITATFAAGAEIGAEITTDGSFAAGANPDLSVTVWVILSIEGI
ncbi:hypothetical protein ACIBI9_31335 [Nonomuraea sp. NPDC050451]|uniref:hypothetical protein n=1 Tax=Nonomuraea sp. NPDC050451 TaxID=3364364 RepID=UPI0037A78EEA